MKDRDRLNGRRTINSGPNASRRGTRGMVILCLCGCLAMGVHAAPDRTWNGPANGDWFDKAHWIPDDNWPQDGETVLIDTGSVLLTNTTAFLNHLQILDATLTLRHWTTELRVVTLSVGAGGDIQPDEPFTAQAGASNRVNIVCTDLTVHDHGVIHADERGYYKDASAGDGVGPGAGAGHNSDQVAAGGGYGGRGGSVYRVVNQIRMSAHAGGDVYGSIAQPTDPGSSGGGIFQRRGGAGGGAIRIAASGTVLVNGRVSANGEAGIRRSAYSGAGSGGSVWISSAVFGGTTGSIEARGGSGVVSGGGGGGGRIAIDYGSVVSPVTVVFDAFGGVGFARDMTDPLTAEFGTLSLPNLDVVADVWSGQIKGAYLHVAGFSSWSATSLTLSDAVLGLPSGFELTIDDLSIESNGGLLLDRTHQLDLGDLWLGSGSFLRMTTNSVLTCSSLSMGKDAAFRMLDSGDLTVQGEVVLDEGARISLHTAARMTTTGGVSIAGPPEQFSYAPQHPNFQSVGTNVTIAIGSDFFVDQGFVQFEQYTRLQSAGDMTLTGGAQLTFFSGETNANWMFGGEIEIAGDMIVQYGSWIYPWSPHSGELAGSLRLAMNRLLIANGAGINGNGRGYRHNNNRQYGDGPGGGLNNLGEGLGHGPGSGGGHGARGGFNSFDLAGGPAYGSINAPATPGSSGAGGWASRGGHGGGAIWIDAADDVVLDGLIAMNGSDGTGGYNGDGGGGAGGAVFIRCLKLCGAETGAITANGGSGLGGNQNNGGGGAGGRIAVWSDVPVQVAREYPLEYQSIVITDTEPPSGFQGMVSVGQGSGWHNPPDSRAAQPGSLYFFSMRRGSVLLFR